MGDPDDYGRLTLSRDDRSIRAPAGMAIPAGASRSSRDHPNIVNVEQTIASVSVSAAAATLPRRGFLLAPGVALLSLLTPGLAKAQPRIGSVSYVRVWAYGTKSADKWGDLFTHDAVVAQQGVRTVRNGAAHIRFVDGTDLRIGGSSELVLDEFVYDTASGAGTFTTNMTKGILRMVTGKLAR